jgi:hypothetical protein
MRSIACSREVDVQEVKKLEHGPKWGTRYTSSASMKRGTHIGNVLLKTGGTSNDLNQPEAIMRRFGLSEK